MSLKSDQYQASCESCGHSQYIHKGGQRGMHGGQCTGYSCKRDKKCKGFKPVEKKKKK